MAQTTSRAPSSSLVRLAPHRAGRFTASRVSAGILLILSICAVAAPLIAPASPDAIDADSVLGAPSLDHLFGSDEFGCDVLSRVLYSYRVSLFIAIGAIGLSLPVGAVIGTVTGYFGRLVDTLVMRPIEMLMAFPALLLGLTMVTIMGSGTRVVILAISIIYLPVFARVTRASAQVVRRELYVEASRTRGASHLHIIAKHVLPNAIGPAVAQATVLAGVAIQIEAALSFLGLGIQPPTPSLGGMLAEGQNFPTQAPWIEIFPGLALAVTVLAFNLLGDSLRDRLDQHGVVQ